MAEPTNDDAARDLERLTTPEPATPRPKPQPKPRIVPTVAKPKPSGAPSAKTARTPAPAARPKPVTAQPTLEQALAESRSKPSTARASVGVTERSPSHGLWLKQTLIPVLFTIGLILISLAIVHFAWKSDDNPVIELPSSITIALMAGGLLAWALAVVNILAVRRILSATDQNPL